MKATQRGLLAAQCQAENNTEHYKGTYRETTTLLAWLEVASSLAVLVTLIYLARQVHQENVLLRSEARRALVATDQQQNYQFGAL